MEGLDTKRLRQKLLDLAVRGRLVPQEPNDEPASVLLARIHQTKLDMVKRGELRDKDVKNDTVIYYGSDGLPYEKHADGKGEAKCIADEVPFELPEGWAWARIASIANEPMYGTSRKSETSGKMPVLRMGNITRVGTIDYGDLAYTSSDEDIEKFALQPGDVIFNRTNSREWVGKVAYYDGTVPAIYAGYLVRFKTIEIDPRYVTQAMCSPYEREWCKRVKTDGVNQSNINAKKLKAFLLPVPPLAEQRRIVAALDKYLALVDAIERDGEELDALLRQLRSKVLDLAIRGDLTEREASDEPASELLARIHAEKLEMAKRGDLKPKDVKSDTVIYTGSDGLRYEKPADGKGEPRCIEDEVPFEIPGTWAWARLLTPVALDPKNNASDDTEVSFLPMAAIDDGFRNTYHPEKRMWKDVKKGYTQFADGDVVFAKISPCFENGKYFVARDLCNGMGAGTTELFVLRSPLTGLNREYLFLFLASNYFMADAKKTFMGSVGQQRIKKDYLEKMLLPVPPLAEQQRIVDKVKAILSQLP